MLATTRRAFVWILLLLPLAAGSWGRESRVVSTYGLTAGVESAAGIRVVPAPHVAAPSYTEDLAPPQVFELVRPIHQPLSVGRLFSSCTCLEISTDKRRFAPGEPAYITVRNVKPTPPDGATYILFAEITEPVNETMQFYATVKSRGPAAMPTPRPSPPPSPRPGPPPGPATPPAPQPTPRPRPPLPPAPSKPPTRPPMPAPPPPRADERGPGQHQQPNQGPGQPRPPVGGR